MSSRSQEKHELTLAHTKPVQRSFTAGVWLLWLLVLWRSAKLVAPVNYFVILRYGASVIDTTSNSCEGIVHMFLYSIKCRVHHSPSLVWLHLSTDKDISFPFGDKIFIRMCKLLRDLLSIKLPERILQQWKVGFREAFKLLYGQKLSIFSCSTIATTSTFWDIFCHRIERG